MIQSRTTNFDERNADGITPLICAVRHKNYAVIEALKDKGVDANAQDEDGFTALTFATSEDDDKCVQSLCEYTNIDVNKRGIFNKTPLECAITNGNLKIIDILIQSKGIDPNTRGNYGQTPLMGACFSHECVKRLLRIEGIDVSIQDKGGKTALDYAAMESDGESANLIKTFIASQNLKNSASAPAANGDN